MKPLAWIAAASALCCLVPRTALAEPVECLSTNPGDWPDPAKPYFLLLVDTSGSMLSCTNPTGAAYTWPSSCPSTAPKNSCGLEPTRINDAKCALDSTVRTFAGEVNFGLVSFPVTLSGCSAGSCIDSCAAADGSCNPPDALGTEGEFYTGNGCTVSGFPDPGANPTCGNTPDCGTNPVPPPPNLAANWRNGGSVLVPLLPDPTWGASPPASNVNDLLEWVDGQCDGSRELFALGSTPLEGILRTAQEYLTTGWNSGWRDGTYCDASPLPLTYTTPLSTLDRPCRSVNVILVTDGDETCFGTPSNAAASLFAGVTSGGQTYSVRTHVIGFAGANQTLVDQIAQAGGTGSALSANDEAQLSQALANIISGAIEPEVCNNSDDNCNGCTDEGYAHWCNERTDCCQWTTTDQRSSCINVYLNSGDPADLPCTTALQKDDPTTWLCYQPDEQCNDQDDDCDGQVDEGFKKCGTPERCPVPETCNGIDDDCDAIVDNAAGSGSPYSVCPNQCVPSPEICDGCDNDCNGIADDGVPDVACGFSSPPNCQGTKSCSPITVSGPGECAAGGNQFGPCNNSPQTEVCDTLDNDCDGVVNNGVAPTPCEIPGSSGLVYQDTFPASQCVKGEQPCNGVCSGYITPSAEVCDGVDNDCNGVVDDNLTGLGQPCGTTKGPCTMGTTACLSGVVVCTGGVQAQPESCNGIDDDCDGNVDEEPLQDAPTDPGCWDLPAGGCATTCSYQGFSWCPPAGATCSDLGTLVGPPNGPCTPGKLACNGSGGWTCIGGELPGAEVCDSSDNDCDGQLNEDLGSPIGDTCGTDVGACEFGTKTCDNGQIVCSGGTQPTGELCNGIDDNCDGNTDEGVPPGGACWPAYDQNDYPGDRTQGNCIQGVRLCPSGGQPECVGGVGPKPEVCDGRDNDCDGEVDEVGPAPDGIDGSANPEDPSQVIGGVCGVTTGECQEGVFECVRGQFACVGGLGPQPEQCDCLDNDCDGEVDEETGADGGATEPLCAPGKACVTANGLCQCAVPCKTGEFPCTLPTTCEEVTVSSTGETPPAGGSYCMDPGPCSACESETYEENGTVLCAPEGTVLDGGASVPVCVCRMPAGCKNPCFGVTCSAGLACVELGSAQGTCQPQDNCNYFGCAPGLACHDSECVDDPCDPNPCGPDEVCKPDEAFADARCVGSCASVTCGQIEQCVDGSCEPTGCSEPCPAGEVCHPADGGGFCWTSNCTPDGGTTCQQGLTCDPVTGQCGDDPCTAVRCPSGQTCRDGECWWAAEAGTDAGSAGSGGSDAGTAPDSGSGPPPEQDEEGIWRLATGGGCSCGTAGDGTSRGWMLALLLVGLGVWRRRDALDGGGER